jgi:uracil-DNA glycosylase family 4
MGALCAECPLNDQRPVAATGPLDAGVVFVGEGPGRFEVIKGECFVGPSGSKLGELLYKNRTTRDQVYVTNAVWCRPEIPGVEGARRYEVKAYVAWFRKQNQMRKKQGLMVQKSPFECCAPRLKWELDWLDHNAKAKGAPNGAVIVPLGNFALAATTTWLGVAGKVGGVMKYRGSVLEAPR